jgi:hypothetical protein
MICNHGDHHHHEGKKTLHSKNYQTFHFKHCNLSLPLNLCKSSSFNAFLICLSFIYVILMLSSFMLWLYLWILFICISILLLFFILFCSIVDKTFLVFIFNYCCWICFYLAFFLLHLFPKLFYVFHWSKLFWLNCDFWEHMCQ